MATIAPKRPEVRSSPTAYEALKKHLAEHPEDALEHTHKWDVSRSDIYVENRWQPIFKEMRDAGPLHYIPESPFGPFSTFQICRPRPDHSTASRATGARSFLRGHLENAREWP